VCLLDLEWYNLSMADPSSPDIEKGLSNNDMKVENDLPELQRPVPLPFTKQNLGLGNHPLEVPVSLPEIEDVRREESPALHQTERSGEEVNIPEEIRLRLASEAAAKNFDPEHPGSLPSMPLQVEGLSYLTEAVQRALKKQNEDVSQVEIVGRTPTEEEAAKFKESEDSFRPPTMAEKAEIDEAERTGLYRGMKVDHVTELSGVKSLVVEVPNKGKIAIRPGSETQIALYYVEDPRPSDLESEISATLWFESVLRSWETQGGGAVAIPGEYLQSLNSTVNQRLTNFSSEFRTNLVSTARARFTYHNSAIKANIAAADFEGAFLAEQLTTDEHYKVLDALGVEDSIRYMSADHGGYFRKKFPKDLLIQRIASEIRGSQEMSEIRADLVARRETMKEEAIVFLRDVDPSDSQIDDYIDRKFNSIVLDKADLAVNLGEKVMHNYGESSWADGIRIKASAIGEYRGRTRPGIILESEPPITVLRQPIRLDPVTGRPVLDSDGNEVKENFLRAEPIQKQYARIGPGVKIDMDDGFVIFEKEKGGFDELKLVADFFVEHWNDIDFGDETGSGGSIGGNSRVQFRGTMFYPVSLEKPGTANRGDIEMLRRYAYLFMGPMRRFTTGSYKEARNSAVEFLYSGKNNTATNLTDQNKDRIFGKDYGKIFIWAGKISNITKNRGILNDRGPDSVLNQPLVDANLVENQNTGETLPKALEKFTKSVELYGNLTNDERRYAMGHLLGGILTFVDSKEASDKGYLEWSDKMKLDALLVAWRQSLISFREVKNLSSRDKLAISGARAALIDAFPEFSNGVIDGLKFLWTLFRGSR
jgi:hypothetical protein